MNTQLLHHLESLYLVPMCLSSLPFKLLLSMAVLSASSPFVGFNSTKKHHVFAIPYPSRIFISTTTSNFPLLRSNRGRDFITCMNKKEINNTPQNKSSSAEVPVFPTVFDINQIQEILPHRYPFLLVDRVIEYNPGVSAVGIKHLTVNEYFFHGHFPGNPIMPGVLILEGMAQVAGIITLHPDVGLRRDKMFLLGAKNFKFRRQVKVGDTLIMESTLLSVRPHNGYFSKFAAKACVGGDLVCEAEMMLYGELLDKDHKSELVKKMERLGRN